MAKTSHISLREVCINTRSGCNRTIYGLSNWFVTCVLSMVHRDEDQEGWGLGSLGQSGNHLQHISQA